MAKMKSKGSKRGAAIKISNKNKTKGRFAKRNAPAVLTSAKKSATGKLRNFRADRNRDNKFREKNRRPQVVKHHDPLDMSDMLPKKEKTPKRKRSAEDDFVESSSESDDDGLESYEKRPRLTLDHNHKKSDGAEDCATNDQGVDGDKNGDDMTDGQPDEENGEDEPEAGDPKHEPTTIELILMKKQKYDEMKERVGKVAMSILASPHRNVVRLKQLLSLLDVKEESDVKMGMAFIKMQSLISYSILEIFKDILPTYRVREKLPEETDTKIRMKKETKELREFETSLLRYYKQFIEKMTRMIDCIKKKRKSSFYDDLLKSRDARNKIAVIGARCLSHLMVSHPNFNMRDEIINVLMPLLTSKSDGLRQVVYDSVIKLYHEDKLGQVSLAAVKSTAKVIKANKLQTHPMAIKTFLNLKIKEVKKRPDEIDMKKLREKLAKLSKKEKRYNKKFQKLKNQLMETEANESQERKLSFHTDILNQIFFVYFRFLKDIVASNHDVLNDSRNDHNRNDCLTPVLKGLSKFCHLINVDFYDDLISLLYQLISSGKLTIHQSLFCLHTVFTVLSGEGSSINVDPQRFYAKFYVTLLELNSSNFKTEDDAILIHNCFDQMIFRRKKSLSLARVTAFSKRLAVISVENQQTLGMTGLFLSVLRNILKDHPKAEILLDQETYGDGKFLPDLTDPEFCHATNARILHEMNQLKNHPNVIIRQLTNSILNINTKKSCASIEIVKKSPLEVFQEIQNNEMTQ